MVAQNGQITVYQVKKLIEVGFDIETINLGKFNIRVGMIGICIYWTQKFVTSLWSVIGIGIQGWDMMPLRILRTQTERPPGKEDSI